MKKNLSMLLRERTETIEYRAIKAKLMAAAQQKRDTFLVMYLQPQTIIQLQNEGINVEQFEEFGTKKLKLSWGVTKVQRLAEQIKWPVDFNERHISVPERELTQAEENAFVNELRGLGFYIQSAIA
jgi:alpha-D-ribose 1-methylphosphonate 5-phosphate C-P lyase